MKSQPPSRRDRQSNEAGRPNSFSSQAAILSLLAALAGVGLNFAFTAALANPSEMTSVLGRILTGGLGMLLLLLGLGFGTIALRQSRRHGRKGTLGLALGGMLLNGVLLGLFGWETVRGNNQAIARQKFHEEALAASQDLGSAATNASTANRFGLDSARLAQLTRELDQAAQNLPGDEERLAKASTSYLARLQGRIGEYNRSLRALQQADVLELKTLQAREQLQTRRKVVEEFLGANESYGSFQANAANHFRDELLSQKVSPTALDQALQEFESRLRQRNPLTLAIRSADAQWGSAMLGIIDLLDMTWGDWAYDPVNEAIAFQDDQDTTSYETFLDIMDAATAEQSAVQQRAMEGK